MARQPQAPPPGVVRNGTPYATPGRWWDVNNIRWRQGILQPTGGNIAYPGAVFDGTPPRDIISWHANDTTHWAAAGTDTKLWAFNFVTQALYDITPAGVGPLDPPGPRVGYSKGDFGDDAYGTAREITDVGPDDVSAFMGDMWSMDTFGEDLYFVPTQDGHLYVWHPATPATKPVIVANAPTNNRGVIVTDQRQVVLLGASGDPRRIQWSDQENPTVWAPVINNMAGQKQLVTQGYIYSALKCTDGILIFTSNDAHMMRYVGYPYAYGITVAGASCAPISPRAPVAAGSHVVWPGVQGWWHYVGTIEPIDCDVGDWFFSLINRGLVGRLVGSPVPGFTELWWDWPDEGSAQENNRYVALIFGGGGSAKNVWTIGQRFRSTGDRQGTMDKPLLGGVNADGLGVLYLHEYGWTDNGTSRLDTTYAESGDIVLGNGDLRYSVRQVAFDIVPDGGQIGYRFFLREQPNGPEYDSGLYTEIHDGLMDVRFSTRGCRMRLETLYDGPFALGRPTLDVVSRGKR